MEKRDIIDDFMNGKIQVSVSEIEFKQLKKIVEFYGIIISDEIIIEDSDTYISVNKKGDLTEHPLISGMEIISYLEMANCFFNGLTITQKRYFEMTESQKHRCYMVSDTNIVVGGTPDILLELVSVLENNRESLGMDLTLILDCLKSELGI